MRLGELRESLGMTQQDVADRLDIPVTTYRKYEYESRQTPMEVLFALADIYDVDLDYLAGRDVSPDESRKAQIDSLYKMLNDEGKDLLLTLTRLIVKSGEYLSI